MKYIDADKIVAEIERRKKELFEIGGDTFENKWACGSLDNIKTFVISLQQDKDVLDLCSQVWWEDRGWIMIPPDATLKGIESLLKQVKKKIKQEHPSEDLEKAAEWSEEDELKLRLCIDALDVGQTRRHIYEQGITPGELIAWLKSLRPQPKQEWSEEEEKDIQKASEYLRDYANNYVQGGNSKLYVQSLADRIESLRPQTQWKPSEEQMEALKLIVSNKKHYAPVLHEIALDTLYNDLKSL